MNFHITYFYFKVFIQQKINWEAVSGLIKYYTLVEDKQLK